MKSVVVQRLPMCSVIYLRTDIVFKNKTTVPAAAVTTTIFQVIVIR